MARPQSCVAVALLSALAATPLVACGEGDNADRNAGGVTEGGRQRHTEGAGGAPTERRREGAGLRAFVAIEDEDRVAMLEGPRWRVVRMIRVASGPHNVAPDPAGRYVAVSSPPAGQVTILNSRGRVAARASPGAGAHDVAFTRNGSALWVSAEDAGGIVKRAVPSGRPIRSRPTSGPPHDLAVSPDGRELWVTIDGSPAVEVRSAGSGELLARPAIGAAPHDVEIEPGGRRVWFSNWSSPLLIVASLREREPVGRLEAGTEPHHFAFGQRWLWATDNGSGELLWIDPRSRRIRGRTRVGPVPHHVAVAGRHVLVAVHGNGQLAVLSRRARLLRRVEVGAGPHGVATLRR